MKRDIRMMANRRWWLLVGPLIAVVLLLAALTVTSVQLLSAARAYVGGESLWSKGQKDAVYHLERYIATRSPGEYRRFEAALAVPLGDRRARLSLDQTPPDREAAWLGFLAGSNHPDDIDEMIELFLRFRHVGFMAKAIEIWAEADLHIAQLASLGRQIEDRVSANDAGSGELATLADELPRLNHRLTELEQQFSSTLGQTSRTVSHLLLVITVVLTALLTAGAALLTRSLLRAQASAEDELRRANERWTLAAGAAGIGLFEWDLQTQRSRIDARGAALYGLPPQAAEVEGGAFTLSRVHPADAPCFRAALARAVAEPTANSLRFRVLLDDGSERHIEAVAQVRPSETGTGPCLVGTLRDVTGDVRTAQLQLDKESAERSSRAKSEFLSRVSHELRTPLNAVLGFAELLHSDAQQPLTPAQAERMQHVIDAGRHLLALIDDILDLSEADDIAPPPALQPVLVSDSLDAALDRMRTTADRQQVSLEADVPAQPLYVMADPSRLSQVWAHVLSNAIKYNRPGGKVKVSFESSGAEVSIRVRDTGSGLRPDQIAQLFQPFNRLGAEASRQPGSGLGLVVAQRLLSRQQGRIEVSSEPGIGTCVEVHLRAAVAPASAASG